MCRSVNPIVAVILVVGCTPALAQPSSGPSDPRWDASATVGHFSGTPELQQTRYADEWYHAGRYGISIGRFWTTHLKTEVEFAATSEASRYVQRFTTVPGFGVLPYGAEEYFRHQQLTARVVWQFFDNKWVHPYVVGGVGADLERKRAEVSEQFHYLGAAAPRVRIVERHDEGPATTDRPVAIAGIGSKLYVSPQAFINTLMQLTWTRPAQSVSFITGVGVDF